MKIVVQMFWRGFGVFWRVQAGRHSRFVLQAHPCLRLCWVVYLCPCPCPRRDCGASRHVGDRAKGTTPAARASSRFGPTICHLVPVVTTRFPSEVPLKCFLHPQPQFPHPSEQA